MGELYHAWTYKPSLSIVIIFILVSTACLGHCSENPAAIGKVYSRGNQWAVGHLMGKKSIDSISGSEERNRDSDYLTTSEEDKLLDRCVRPSVLIRAFVRALVGLENQGHVPSPQGFLRTRQRGEQERDKYLKEVTDLLLAFNLKENSSR